MKLKCRGIKHRFCHFRGSKCGCVIGAFLVGILVILIFISGFSLLISCFDASDDLVSCMAAIALCAGSFAAGFTFARRRRRHGLISGIGIGILIYLAVFLTGIVLLKSFSGAGTFMKFILILICSCIGGVCGVNTRICKPPK